MKYCENDENALSLSILNFSERFIWLLDLLSCKRKLAVAAVPLESSLEGKKLRACTATLRGALTTDQMTTDRKTIDRSNFSGFEELLRMLLGSVLQYFLRTILAFLADLADTELTCFLTTFINYHKFGNRLRSTQCYLHSLWLPRLQARQPQSPKSAQINSGESNQGFLLKSIAASK